MVANVVHTNRTVEDAHIVHKLKANHGNVMVAMKNNELCIFTGARDIAQALLNTEDLVQVPWHPVLYCFVTKSIVMSMNEMLQTIRKVCSDMNVNDLDQPR